MQVSAAVVFALLILSGFPLFADEVYKSVDEEGNVTYSTTPPPNAVDVQAVDLPPGPSEQQVREATERASATQKTVDEMTELRRKKDQEYRERREKARQESKEQSPAEQPDDRYYGYRRGYPIYPGPVRPRPPAAKPPIAVPLPVVPGGSL